MAFGGWIASNGSMKRSELKMMMFEESVIKFADRTIKSARTIWALFLDIVFPVECVGCNQEGIWLCSTCRQAIEISKNQGCPICRKYEEFGAICPECRPNHSLDGILIAYPYDDKRVSGLIKICKYNFSREVGGILGGLLSSFLDEFLLNQGMRRDFSINPALPKRWPRVLRNLSDALLIPVPLHPRRKRWRGFNQSEILADSLSENFGLVRDIDGLKRIQYTRPQAKLSKGNRESSMKDECFAWTGENLHGKRIILIDDVAATGATLDACASVLKKAGAGQVWGLVLARG